MIDLDEKFMTMAIEEARNGLGFVNPNPLVGAIVVKNGTILGRGYHQKYGGPHAEVNAILDAKKYGNNVEESTLYVNLEPCSHSNKQTPPCAPMIAKEKIKKVVIANLDPNPFVSGNGVQYLRDHHVEVVIDVLQFEGEKLNEVYFKNMRFKKPFVHLKLAQTLDGKVATLNGESKYITGLKALEYSHSLRQAYDAIIVGKNTVLLDDPSLTVRLNQKTPIHPKRLIWIDLKSINLKLKVFSDEYKKNTIVVTTQTNFNTHPEVVKTLNDQGIEIWALAQNDDGRIKIEDFLVQAQEHKLNSLLVEGGPNLASQFLKANLVDKISMITAPYILGSGRSSLQDIGVDLLAQKKEIKRVTSQKLGNDFLIEGYLCSQD